MANDDQVLYSTKQWLCDHVIELNLCPFAKREFLSNNIRYVVSEADQDVDLVTALYNEIVHLTKHQDVTTTLLIHPKLLNDFNHYNQFLDLAEGLLEQQGWQGEYQIASFHPNYQFADTNVDDAENYTNRSPYPLLHILREDNVEKAIQSYPDIEQVPIKNIQLMQDIGSIQLQTRLTALINSKRG